MPWSLALKLFLPSNTHFLSGVGAWSWIRSVKHFHTSAQSTSNVCLTLWSICIQLLQSFSAAHLLLKQHRVDGLATRQDHHGESNGHRHHEAHTDHLCYYVGGEVHQHITSDVLCEADVAEEPHLVHKQEQRELGWNFCCFLSGESLCFRN